MKIDYNEFHRKTKIQYKIIDRSNYTYFNVIRSIEKIPDIAHKSKLKILDYGCGAGTMSLYLASLGHSVIGVDISTKAIESATNSGRHLHLKNVQFHTIDKSKDILKSETFDLVLCVEVLEHIRDDKSVLEMFNKVLKKHGKILITVPADSAPLYKIGLLNSFDKEVGHLRRYSYDGLKSLIENSNFKVIDISVKESVFRNVLFCLPYFGFLIKFMKGIISLFFMYTDKYLVKAFGGSNLYVLAQKNG